MFLQKNTNLIRTILFVAITLVLIAPRTAGTFRKEELRRAQFTTGVASWYGKQFHGRKMANRRRFDMHDPTIAASKTLPFGTKLKVTNEDTGKTAVVVVMDRGPYVSGRMLDLSSAAAKRLGYLKQGTARLTIRIVDENDV